ncbi:hypothetical protein [Streptomyces canus]|uniref:hypothetical protein n=1 Tax=Streptomyces canus TaxID=58343 RepID=UPI0036EA6145
MSPPSSRRPYARSSPAEPPGAHDGRTVRLPGHGAPFARQVETRSATADLPPAGDDRAELLPWVRFMDGRPLDAGAVVTLTDVLPPALYAVWRSPRPVPGGDLTAHFTDALDESAGWAASPAGCAASVPGAGDGPRGHRVLYSASVERHLPWVVGDVRPQPAGTRAWALRRRRKPGPLHRDPGSANIPTGRAGGKVTGGTQAYERSQRSFAASW